MIHEAVKAFNETYSAHLQAATLAEQELAQIAEALPEERKLPYAIDLMFVDPFAPYVLKCSRDAVDRGLAAIVEAVKPTLPEFGDDWVATAVAMLDRTSEKVQQGPNDALVAYEVVQLLRDTQKDAAKAHKHLDAAKMFMFGVGGAALIAITAGAAAPFVGTAVGATAGLSGAAALLHGLAMIGGGSLAAGGWGMAGGFWILTGTGALVGAAGGSTTAALVSLGAEGARAELMKLQVTFKHVIIPRSKREAADAIATVLLQRDEVRNSHHEAAKRNEDDAPAVKDLERLGQALTDAATWMARVLEQA